MRAAVVLIIAIVGGTKGLSLISGEPIGKVLINEFPSIQSLDIDTDNEILDKMFRVLEPAVVSGATTALNNWVCCILDTNYLEDNFSSDESGEFGFEDNGIPAVAAGTLFNKKTNKLPMNSNPLINIMQQHFQAKQESEQKINAFRQESEAAKTDSEQKINNLQQLLGQLRQKECNNALPKLTMKERTEKVEKETIIEYNSAKQVSNCPESFVSINGGCYHFNSYDLKDWNVALKKCQTLDSRSSLVTIESQLEWNSIRNYLTENKMDMKNWWIGGSDQEVEGSWKWAATNQPIEYSDWCRDEPNNHDGVEDCALIAGLAEGFNKDIRLCWNDFPCRWNMGLKLPLQFICEIKNN